MIVRKKCGFVMTSNRRLDFHDLAKLIVIFTLIPAWEPTSRVNGLPPTFSIASLRQLADKVGSRLHQVTKLVSGHDEIKKGFSDLYVKIDEMDPAEAVKQYGEKLSQAIKKKIVALERLVETAEETAASHPWKNDINITYHNAKETDGGTHGFFDPIDFHRDPRFLNEPINLDASTVHVPTNVFSRSVVVQNGVDWSKKLDASFRYNFEENPTVRGQHFCSSTGFERIYPGIRWPFSKDPEKPEMYDCRLARWYIQAASSPKDLVILLDISGSMTGLRRETAKRTVMAIMDTLNEDDFFNVLTFKNDTYFLDPCLNNTLLPATKAHKKHLSRLMQHLDTEDFANYTVALPVAFNLLARNDTARTSGCNKAIMIVSDNAPEAFEDICRLYNPDRSVRFFAYVIGREVTEYEGMTELACNNRGFVAHITTIADVRDYVEEYYQVLGRPMVLHKNHTNIWTTAHSHPRDVLGPLITVAQPVFNRSAEAGAKGSLIGVVSLDIPVEDIRKTMAPHKWGVGSYVFGINHNGRVIFHPHWKTLQKGKVSAPIQNEVDLSELEQEVATSSFNITQEHELRKKMIDLDNGTHQMRVLRQMDGGKRAYERNYQYFFSRIAGTPFSIGLAIPSTESGISGSIDKLHGARRPRAADAVSLNSTDWTIHPNWYYCETTMAHFPNLTVVLENLLSSNGLSAEDTHDLSCDKDLMESLMFDAQATRTLGDYWISTKDKHRDLYELYGITTSFVSTRAGLTRWKEVGDSTPSRDLVSSVTAAYSTDVAYPDDIANQTFLPVLETKHYFRKHSRAVEEGWYQRTVGGDLEALVTVIQDEPESANLTSDFLMVTTPVYVAKEEQKDISSLSAAVAGLIMSSQSLLDSVRQTAEESCKGLPNCVSCHSPHVNCYLLDESAFVVVDSRYPENSGKFFGVLQSEVMLSLVDSNIFKRYELRDYQAMCQPVPPTKTSSSASLLASWLTSAFGSLHLLTRTLMSLSVTLLAVVFAVDDEYYHFEPKVDINGTMEAMAKKLPPPYSCDAQYALFHSSWVASELIAEVECTANNCTKNIAVVKVPHTNLILVALDNLKSCLCNGAVVDIKPTEIIFTTEEKCNRFMAFPHRRKPTECYSYFKEEDYSECGRPWVPYQSTSATPRLRATLSYGMVAALIPLTMF
ncbi:hypothetical protein RvY_05069 [Ramazzottius varieornatus]|uniref:VWFA domain-containing protein n=1 Tax=Ramazzottius varieornatus TaxID=947166 RepID=A0A1D1UUD8_RAMVA|nr:hypothetical protein RvY_05069 [Ramazzottius varieornatus]